MNPNNTSVAPGWYPDPRPGHGSLQAWWDGHQWHLGATKPTTKAEIAWWIRRRGRAGGMVLGVMFPPLSILQLGRRDVVVLPDQEEEAARPPRRPQWYQQHGTGPQS